MTKRRLRPDELELWQTVAKSAERLHPERRKPVVAAKTERKPRKGPASEPAPIPKFKLGQKVDHSKVTKDVLPGLAERLSGAPLNMDRKRHLRMKRGKLEPEGRIDLHGMTLAEAHPALTGFILQSHAMGRRLVLVITGKGKSGQDYGPIPRRKGVLRHQVPQWLRMAPMNSCILQISEAHLKHGGGGAYYVYLRKSRG